VDKSSNGSELLDAHQENEGISKKESRGLMKSFRIRHFVVTIIFNMIVLALASCSQNKDATVKADLTTKAKTEKDFAGVRFTVENGIVTLNGQCATEKARSSVYAKVEGLYGVERVINNISIGPVVIGTDELLKQGVDSVLKKYAGVQAIVRDSVVQLEGRVKSRETKELIAAIEKLGPERIDTRLLMR
jgi:hypothetical protein